VIVIIYILTGRQLKLSGSDLFIIAILAVFTHSAYDFVRDFLAQRVHHQQHQTRRELETLGRDVSTDESLQLYLNRSLSILCKNLNTICGFIAIRKESHFTVVASYHSLRIGEIYSINEIALEEVTQTTTPSFPQIAWIAPGYAEMAGNSYRHWTKGMGSMTMEIYAGLRILLMKSARSCSLNSPLYLQCFKESRLGV
jgi:hypothetical protein